MNILIKLSSIVALIIAPHISTVKHAEAGKVQEIKIEKMEKVSTPGVEVK
jgi:hypothetical protein